MVLRDQLLGQIGGTEPLSQFDPWFMMDQPIGTANSSFNTPSPATSNPLRNALIGTNDSPSTTGGMTGATATTGPGSDLATGIGDSLSQRIAGKYGPGHFLNTFGDLANVPSISPLKDLITSNINPNVRLPHNTGYLSDTGKLHLPPTKLFDFVNLSQGPDTTGDIFGDPFSGFFSLFNAFRNLQGASNVLGLFL